MNEVFISVIEEIIEESACNTKVASLYREQDFDSRQSKVYVFEIEMKRLLFKTNILIPLLNLSIHI